MSGALCYPPCKDGYEGNGPVCWQKCPEGKVNCGGALCVDSSDACTDFAKSMAESVITGAVAVAAVVLTDGAIGITEIIKSLGSVATDLANGICDAPTTSTSSTIQIIQ